MDLVSYLTEIYGYDTPIFIKDVRIGRKSKSAIREEFYRATKSGKLERSNCGVYFVRSNKEFGSGIIFTDILKSKFLFSGNTPEYMEELYISGYYSGQTFLNIIGISEQVPAVVEITTNNTSSKKAYYSSGKSVAILRKPKTTINFQNWKILQFLEMFSYLTLEEVKNKKDIIINYAKKNQLSKQQFIKYIGLFSPKTMKKIVEGGIINAFI